jgi:hypothetical protein
LTFIEGINVTLRRIIILGIIVLVCGITVAQVFLNQGGLPFGNKSDQAGTSFRVGFLPVT